MPEFVLYRWVTGLPLLRFSTQKYESLELRYAVAGCMYKAAFLLPSRTTLITLACL